MNAMLASGGYPWTVIRFERWAEYLVLAVYFLRTISFFVLSTMATISACSFAGTP